MDCRHALKVRELALDRLAGSPEAEADETFLATHLASCDPCRAEVEGMSAVWTRLGEDDGADLSPSPAFVARATAAMAGKAAGVAADGARAGSGSGGRIVPFPARQARENLVVVGAAPEEVHAHRGSHSGALGLQRVDGGHQARGIDVAVSERVDEDRLGAGVHDRVG